MKTKTSTGLRQYLSGMNRSYIPTATATVLSRNTGGSEHLISPLSSATTEMEASAYGSNKANFGSIAPENDFKGLHPAWLRKQADAAYFAMLLFCVLAAHITFLSVACTSNGLYLHAVLLAGLASLFWGKVVTNYRFAGRCMEAAAESAE